MIHTRQVQLTITLNVGSDTEISSWYAEDFVQQLLVRAIRQRIKNHNEADWDATPFTSSYSDCRAMYCSTETSSSSSVGGHARAISSLYRLNAENLMQLWNETLRFVYAKSNKSKMFDRFKFLGKHVDETKVTVYPKIDLATTISLMNSFPTQALDAVYEVVEEEFSKMFLEEMEGYVEDGIDLPYDIDTELLW